MISSDDGNSKKTIRWTGIAFVIPVVFASVAGGAIWAFSQHNSEAVRETDQRQPIEAPTRVVTEHGLKQIIVDEAIQKQNGIKAVRISPRSFHTQVRAYGTVMDLTSLTELNNKYANAKSLLQTAEARLAASKSAFERAQHLYQRLKVVSLAQFQSAESTFRIDSATVGAAQSLVRTLSATAYQEWGSVLGKSLIEGSPLVSRLIEREEYLLIVTLPARALLAKAPMEGLVKFEKRTSVPITYVSPATRTDPKIQGISLFYTASATSGLLPGMNVLVFLPSDTAVNGITIPSDAVVWWQSRAWVYRRVNSEHFERVPISTELTAPSGGYIVVNLSGATEFVIQGAQFLLSEEFRTQLKRDED